MLKIADCCLFGCGVFLVVFAVVCGLDLFNCCVCCLCYFVDLFV